MRRLVISVFVFAVLCAASAGAQSTAKYRIVAIPDLGAGGHVAFLNAHGEVAVSSYLPGTGFYRAQLFSGGVTTDLGTLGYESSCPGHINDLGDVVGGVWSGSGPIQPYVYTDGVMSPLGTLGGRRGHANSINNQGQIVGWSDPAVGPYHAFLWEDGVFTDLGTAWGSWSIANDITSSGQIVGYYGKAGGRVGAFSYADGVVTELEGPYPWVRAEAVNDEGVIVGWAGDYPAAYGPVRFQDGTAVPLGSLGGSAGWAWDVNNLGHVVGFSDLADGRPHAFVHLGDQIQDLNALIPPDSGWELMVGWSINDGGMIGGIGCPGSQVTGLYQCSSGPTYTFLLVPNAGIDDLIDLIDGMDLQLGIKNSLLVKLEHARDCYTAGDVSGACNHLESFENEVNAQAGKAITTAQAEQILGLVTTVTSNLGCTY